MSNRTVNKNQTTLGQSGGCLPQAAPPWGTGPSAFADIGIVMILM